MSDSSELLLSAFHAYRTEAPKDQLSAKLLNASLVLAVETIGIRATIDGLLTVLAAFAEECPGEFEAIKALHTIPNNALPRA